jgi:hypothetical protein
LGARGRPYRMPTAQFTQGVLSQSGGGGMFRERDRLRVGA